MITEGTSAPILLLGATTACGQALIERLSGQGVRVVAVSRRAPSRLAPHVLWLQQDLDQEPASIETNVLISVGPLIHALRQLEQAPRLGRVIAISSASTEFKAHSRDENERALIARLIAQEQALIDACRQRGIVLTLLKPTMIYGGVDNANVARVGALGERLRCLPYCGRGLRHPVHADDLARQIQQCVIRSEATAGVWLVGGGEVLEYPAMLKRIASARGRSLRLLPLPLWLMRMVLSVAHRWGRLVDVRPVMLERQRMDLIVDDAPARERIGWEPRAFRP
jgi:nucleoside-diphosphate-sugar epimerase